MYVYSGSKNEETVYFFVYSYQINILDYTRDRHNTDNRYLGYRPSGNQSQSTGSPTSSRTVQFRPRLLWRLVVPYTKIAISVHQIVRRRPNPNRPWTTNSHDPNRSACCIPTYWVKQKYSSSSSSSSSPPQSRSTVQDFQSEGSIENLVSTGCQSYSTSAVFGREKIDRRSTHMYT